jgi:hypothetical protein
MGNPDNWDYDYTKDNPPKKPRKNFRLIYLVPIFAILGVAGFFYVWQNLYSDTTKCDDEISQVNGIINSTGSIDANDTLVQQLGVDGCADLSKISGVVTNPFPHLSHAFKP